MPVTSPVGPDALRLACRVHPQLWWEGFGAIRDKAGKLLSAKRGVAPRANEMQRKVVAIYRYCRKARLPCRIIVYKPRQKGASTISTALLTHHLRNFVARACIIGDEYEKSVKNLVAMVHGYVAEDDFPWGNTFHPPSGKFSHGSELVTETANDPRAGASGTLQALLATEVAHWKTRGVASADKVLLAIENCMAWLPDTLEIIESTANGIGGAFYDKWQGAVEFEDYQQGRRGNGFVKVFAPWFAFADSTVVLNPQEEAAVLATLDEEEVRVKTLYGLNAGQLAWRRRTLANECGGDPFKFAQEYPSDPVSGFVSSGRQRFNAGGMAYWSKLAQTHRATPGILSAPRLGWQTTGGRPVFVATSENEAWLQRWEEPRPGNRYLVAVDPATGAEQQTGAKREPDCHAALVLRAGGRDLRTGAWHRARLVARVAPPCRVDIDLLADFVAGLSRYYGSCLVVPEMNGHGLALVELLKQQSDIPLYRRPVYSLRESKQTEVLGWQTSDGAGRTGTRSLIIEGLAAAIRDWDKEGTGLDVSCPHVAEEATTFVVKESGKAEAMDGYHDDDIMALAFGLHCLGEATPYPEAVADRRMPADLAAMLARESEGGAPTGQYS